MELKVRVNAKIGYCELCGAELKPGEGRLEFVPDAHDNDDFDRVGTDREHAHWEVFCLAEGGCVARKEAARNRQAAARSEKDRNRREAEAALATAKQAKREAWEALTAGLEKTTATPGDWKPTGEFVDSGLDARCEKIVLPGGGFGWCVSWIGDSDGHYFLVPASAKESAEAEKARLDRIYQWWRPKCYNAEDYPGPSVPEEQLTPTERAEVAARFAEKYEAAEADWKKRIPSAIVRGSWKNSRGCEAWELLTAIGAEVEIVTDPNEFREFCKAYADSKLYSKERESLKLVVLLRANLPATARNKNGTVKAAIKNKMPAAWPAKSTNNFIAVRVECA